MRSVLVSLMLIVMVGNANALTRLEGNAQDVPCTWSNKHGQSGKDVCHITAQGTTQGEINQIFKIGNYPLQYSIVNNSVRIVNTDNGKTWNGQVISNEYTDIHSSNSTQTLILSNGMSIKMIH